jgi:hypothetical protein
MNQSRVPDFKLRLRHQAMLKEFDRLGDPADPWMSRVSQNDADTLIIIGRKLRGPFSVYCWRDADTWTALTTTKVASVLAGQLTEVFYDDIASTSVSTREDMVEVNGKKLWAPAAVKSKVVQLIDLMRQRIAEGG